MIAYLNSAIYICTFFINPPQRILEGKEGERWGKECKLTNIFESESKKKFIKFLKAQLLSN